MKTLVISDIHGNWPALQAVAETPDCREADTIISLGDLVGYGPWPAACVDWVQTHAQVAVQGNHDRAYGEDVPPRCGPAFQWLSEAVAPLTRARLTSAHRQYLADLPRWASLDIEGKRYVFIHAAPTDPLYRYIGPDPRQWRAELASVVADVLVVGHTHLQFMLPMGSRAVVNPGSVGQPKDGDPRAAYLIIEDGICRLKRVAYPIDETARGLCTPQIDEAASTVLAELLYTGVVPAMPPTINQVQAASSPTPTKPHADRE